VVGASTMLGIVVDGALLVLVTQTAPDLIRTV
jgi:hypothetical protein